MPTLTLAHSKSQLLSTVPQSLLEPMFRAAVYSTLISSLPLYEDTFFQLQKDWYLQKNEIDTLGIVSCPRKIANLIASSECSQSYGDLSAVPGFYAVTRLPCDCSECEVCGSFEVQLDQLFEKESCICALPSWRIDIDERRSDRGVILPTRDARGWITSLWIYRHTRDRYPFPLKVRKEVAA